MTNATEVAGLRELAAWFEAHPDVVIPYSLRGGIFYVSLPTKSNERSGMLRHIGSFEKLIDNMGDFCAEVKVGCFTLRWYTPRENVCTAKVVGKKQVPEKVIPPTNWCIIPAHEEDIIEWDCSSVLASEERPRLESEEVVTSNQRSNTNETA